MFGEPVKVEESVIINTFNVFYFDGFLFEGRMYPCIQFMDFPSSYLT